MIINDLRDLSKMIKHKSILSNACQLKVKSGDSLLPFKKNLGDITHRASPEEETGSIHPC